MTESASVRGIGAGIVLFLACFISIVSTGQNDARAETTTLKITIGYISEAIPEAERLAVRGW